MSEQTALSAILLDRDGTIIEDAHYPKDPELVQFCADAVPGLKLLMEKGYLLYVVSNQSGVGRGIIRDEEFLAVHRRFCEILQREGIDIVEFSYCFSRPDDPSPNRKPATGMAPKEYRGRPIAWSRCRVIGDRLSDLQLGDNMGAQSSLVRTGKGADTEKTLPQNHPYEVYDTLLDFAVALEPAS